MRNAIRFFGLLLILAALPILRAEETQNERDEYALKLARRVEERPTADPASLGLYLDRIKNLLLSDPYYFYYRVSAVITNGTLVVGGEVERPEFKEMTRLVLEKLQLGSVIDRIEVLPDRPQFIPPFGVVTSASASTYSSPPPGGPMDQALLGEPVYILKESETHYLIKTFSGYWGYVPRQQVRRLSAAEFVVRLNSPAAWLERDFMQPPLFIPAGSRLLIDRWGLGRRCRLRGPGNEIIVIPKSLCSRQGRHGGRAQRLARLLATARSFLRAPYDYGGKNSQSGIDCSGLVQIAYRSVGVNLPRDAKQQYIVGNLVATAYFLDALLPGDALYFVDFSGRVSHTALYLGNKTIIHATGDHVQIHSIDPNIANYYKRFASDFIGAKRFLW